MLDNFCAMDEGVKETPENSESVWSQSMLMAETSSESEVLPQSQIQVQI